MENKLDTFKLKLDSLILKCNQLLQTGELQRGKPEENTKQRLIRPLLESLGYTFKKEIIPEFKVTTTPRTAWVDYALLNDDDVPLVFIEAKSLHENRVLSFTKEILGYLEDYNRPENKVNREGFVVSWGILTNFKEIHFFFVGEKEPFLSISFEELKENSELLWNLLEYDNLKNDKIASEYRERTKKELDKDFLSDLKKWRLIIANGFYQFQPNLSIDEIKEASQRWIDRLIFIRIFENKGLLPYHWIRKVFASWKRDTINKEMNPFSDEIRRKFREFESLYDTDLFKPNMCDSLKIDNKLISEIIKVYGPPDTKVQKLLGLKNKFSYAGLYGYNFNSLSIDVLGSIYERYLAHNIEIRHGKVIIDETQELRKKEGIYYTPQYVIDYIIDNTIKPKTESIFNASKTLLDKRKYKEAYTKINKITDIKVLDPACGSGSFLIKTFNMIAQYYIKYNYEVNKHIEKLRKSTGRFQKLDSYSAIPAIVENVGEKVLISTIHGVDLDKQAVEIAKLNLWRALVLLEPEKFKFEGVLQKSNKKMLPILENNIKLGNSIINDNSVSQKAFRWEEQFASIINNGGFDVIIGNPPYGAELSKEERKYISKNYSTAKSYKNSALVFLERGFTLLNKKGNLGFILPKSLTYSQGWGKGVELILEKLTNLVDASKAFKDVLLEQVVVILNSEQANEYYQSAFFENEQVSRHVSIPKDTYESYKTLIPSVTSEEFEIYKKINLQNHFFKDVSITFRGLPWQKYITSSGDTKILRGDDIVRFGIKDSSDFVDLEKIDESKSKIELLRQPKIISQNIIAHVLKPTPHIIIMSALDPNGMLNLDTVNNTVLNYKEYSLEYLLCILNCKLTSWYAYRFIYNKAIRTMHFDNYYVGRIPIPKNVDQKQFVALGKKMTQLIKRKQSLLNAFQNLIENKKNDQKDLIWLLNNSAFIDAITSKNINPKIWDTTVYDRIQIKAFDNTIEIKTSDSMLMKIVFKDSDLALYCYSILKNYEEASKLVKKTLKKLCTYIVFPIINPNPHIELKEQVIQELKKSYKDIDLISIDNEIEEAEGRINELVYELYGLTEAEKIIIEEH